MKYPIGLTDRARTRVQNELDFMRIFGGITPERGTVKVGVAKYTEPTLTAALKARGYHTVDRPEEIRADAAPEVKGLMDAVLGRKERFPGYVPPKSQQKIVQPITANTLASRTASTKPYQAPRPMQRLPQEIIGHPYKVADTQVFKTGAGLGFLDKYLIRAHKLSPDRYSNETRYLMSLFKQKIQALPEEHKRFLASPFVSDQDKEQAIAEWTRQLTPEERAEAFARRKIDLQKAGVYPSQETTPLRPMESGTLSPFSLSNQTDEQETDSRTAPPLMEFLL